MICGKVLRAACALLLISSSGGVSTDSTSKIQAGLFSTAEEKKTVLVSFGTTHEFEEIAYKISEKYSYFTKERRIYALYEALNEYANKCQNPAQSYLESNNYQHTKMWSSNTIVVKDADQKCVETLAEMDDVTNISEDVEIKLEPIVIAEEGNTEPAAFKVGFTWGLDKIDVKQAWKFGNYYGEPKTGKGVVVATIDSGVNLEHEALRDNFRSYAGWKDGYDISDVPIDNNGHGTHTMGTIIGKYGIGVAPGAQWITCRGCIDSACHRSALLACCEWIVCPHNSTTGGPSNYRDCYSAPDIVSNSWGGGQGSDWYDRCIYAWQAAGIIPVFANGNAGPNCTTANSPGDNEYVIAVGATDKDDQLAVFSSKGPTVGGRLKPEVSAPGVQVISAWFNGTKSYVSISGTSMATPHVAGIIALMLERCRLDYKTVLDVLQSTAEKEYLGTTEQVCGGIKSDQFPNHFYGAGRVNALEAVKQVVHICHIKNNKSYRMNIGNYGNGHSSSGYLGGYNRPAYGSNHNYK